MNDERSSPHGAYDFAFAGVRQGVLRLRPVAGAASVALMSATNLLLYSNFRWLLLLPALLWLAGLLCYLRESAASPTIETQTPTT